MKVMIAVTHLLGTGHLFRALTLGRAFAAAGHDATVISGGMPVPHLNAGPVRLHQLPPLQSEGTDFRTLLTADGTPATEPYMTERSMALGIEARTHGRDILITELFPFGRRILTREFMALLKSARSLPRAPVVFSSIRDILAPPSSPEKAAKCASIIDRHYDAVLVHADPDVVQLEDSWPVTPEIATRLHYTGFVARPPVRPHPDGLGTGEILVSAGGGAVGLPVFRAAMQAASLMPDHTWRILIGGSDPETRVTQLRAEFPDSPARIEPARRDFRQMLPLAAASVSLCGYNTAMDLLQSGTPSVLVPFDDGTETEQEMRADKLAMLPGFRVLPSGDLTAQSLCNALRDVRSDPPRGTNSYQLDGAEQTVSIACNLAEARR